MISLRYKCDIVDLHWGLRHLADDRVQIIIRTTEEQRNKIKDMARERNVSMNQFILDVVLDSTTDSDDSKSDSYYDSNDSRLIEVLEKQLLKKDEQIEKIQTLLDQQQQLTLQSNRQIEQLQLAFTQQNNEPPETKTDEKNPSDRDQEQTGYPESNQKKGIFSRLFNR